VHIFSIFGRLYHINRKLDMHIFSILSRMYHINSHVFVFAFAHSRVLCNLCYHSNVMCSYYNNLSYMKDKCCRHERSLSHYKVKCKRLKRSLLNEQIKLSMIKEANKCSNGNHSSKCEKCPIIQNSDKL